MNFMDWVFNLYSNVGVEVMDQLNNKIYDCEPTLSDSQVLDFCKNGYLLLKDVVPSEINSRVMEFMERDTHYEPTGILDEDWFIKGVILNEQVAGVVRSLLGANFHIPILMSNHQVIGPYSATGGWHVDGNYNWNPELNYLQVFYYPQDTPLEVGPTEVLPGSHLIRNKARFMGHLNAIRGAVPTVSPAGSIFLTVYQIWHRRGRATVPVLRNMLKYVYWRMSPPQRDWVIEPDFDFSSVSYGGSAEAFAEQFRGDCKTAEMFLWLCGKHDVYQNLGGQSWPLPALRNDTPYGYPAGLDS